MIKHLLTDPEVLNIYRRGSIVYGTANIHSDQDYVVVATNKYNPVLICPDITYLTLEQFNRALDNNDIVVLECMYLSPEHILKSTVTFVPNIDKGKLREAISTICNGSWVKGKKKLTVLADYEPYLAVKSIFHSIRILDYGIQLADFNEIRDYKRVNYIWEDLYKLLDLYSHDELWEIIQAKYHKVFREKSTEFKKLCPKDNIPDHKLKQDLIKLFTDNNCYSQDVINSKLITKIVSLVNTL